MKTMENKKREFQTLFLSGKYTQQQIADRLEVSRMTISQWIKGCPATAYIKARKRLAKELDRLSVKPSGNEDLIFRYIEHLDLLDHMIRKAKYLPKI